MQIMKCPQKPVTIMQGCHANPKFHRLKLWIWRFYWTGSSIHLPCYPLTGAYRHKHPLTLTHTHAHSTDSHQITFPPHACLCGRKAECPCRHGENKHTPERNRRVTYSNGLAEQGQNAAFVFTVGKPRNLQKV